MNVYLAYVFVSFFSPFLWVAAYFVARSFWNEDGAKLFITPLILATIVIEVFLHQTQELRTIQDSFLSLTYRAPALCIMAAAIYLVMHIKYSRR